MAGVSEATYWAQVRNALAPFGMLRRIENALELGTPDVAYCLRRQPTAPAFAGWVELKVFPRLPQRDPVRIPHLTREQVRWGEEWVAAGGHSWLLLKAAQHHLLLYPPVPRRLFDGMLDSTALIQGATVAAEGRFPAGRILKALTTGW